MIRLRQPEPRVVDVVTDLVEQGAQIRAERDNPLLLGRPHPELDLRLAAPLLRIETVQLPPARVGARGEDLDPHVREPHRVGEPGDQLLARPFRRGALLGIERGFERRDS